MKKYFRNEANSLRAQKKQLHDATHKLSEIDSILSEIKSEQQHNSQVLDGLIEGMEALLSQVPADIHEEVSESEIAALEEELNKEIEAVHIDTVEEIDFIALDSSTSWDEYLSSLESYSERQNISLDDDPFKNLMTKSQQVAIQKRIHEEFTLKNADCDMYDYMIAGTCGVIGGLIDVLFIGTPGNSKLGDITDEQANKITETFASFVGWDRDKAIQKGSDTTASAIGFLEKKFQVNYDQATTYGKNGTAGAVPNLSMSNHHLKSLGHSPDIIGLFFSILNQFTSTSTFIHNGKLITIETKTFELQGSNVIAKVFCGFVNWFGHIMSDWTGSSGATGRGSGVPMPFYHLFQMMNFGEFGQHKQTFATVTTKVFESGYDLRHGMAMAVPVVITELLIRFMYTMKARFYHRREWKDSMPNANIPELRRMLLVGHGSLCLIDGADAYLHSGGEMVSFLSRTNLPAWVRFGHLGLKELNAWYHAGHIDADAVDMYLEQEYRSMLTNKGM